MGKKELSMDIDELGFLIFIDEMEREDNEDDQDAEEEE